MRPASAPSRMSDTDIDAVTPMLRRYSMWIGETLRSTEKLRSSGAPLSGSSSGTSRAGRYEMSGMIRSQFSV